MDEYNKAQERKSAFYRNENQLLSKRRLESNEVESSPDEVAKKVKPSDNSAADAASNSGIQVIDGKNVICRHAKYYK